MRLTVRTASLVLLLHTVLLLPVASQPKCTITNYSVEDGLSEGVVLTMHQDREGFIWFGTFDGLNRFDGYSFKVYKSGFRENNRLRNNRVDRIAEDDLGYLWVMTYDGEIYRMNTRTEEFINFNEMSLNSREEYSPVQQVYCFSNGETWITTESGRSLRILSLPSSSDTRVTQFSAAGGESTGSRVNLIYKDRSDVVWIMADDGLSRVLPQANTTEKITFTSQRGSNDSPVFCVHEFDDRLWFGTTGGRIRVIETETGTDNIIKMDVGSDIISIKPLNQREFIILTSGDGFYVYNPLTGDRKHYSSERYPVIPTNRMVSVYIDRYGEAWIETAAPGVVHFDPFNNSLKHFRMKVDRTNPNVLLPSFVIFEDKNDILWVYPRGGGFSYYNRGEKKLEYFFNEPGSPDRRFPNLIHSAMSDAQGNLWMCTISRGIEKITFFPNQFRILQPKPVTASHSENEVRALFEDRDKNLWVATRDGFVYLYDSTMKSTGYLRENGSFRSGREFTGLIYSITQDHDGNIWLGSKGRGIFRLESEGRAENRKYKVTNYTHDPLNPFSLSHDNVYSIFEDTYGRIWIATFNGGINYISRDGDEVRFINAFNRLSNYPLSGHKRVRYITADHNNNIWVGTTNGLLIFDQRFREPEEITFRSAYFDPYDEASLGNNDVHYIYCSPDSDIYVATFGGGLNRVIDPGSDTVRPAFRAYTVSTGAPDDVILSIVDDLDGNLWLSSERGILKFNRKSEAFEIYSEQSGVERRYFSEATCLRRSDGEIFFGFDDGAYYFNPALVRKANFVPPLAITRVTVSGNEMPGAEMLPASTAAEPGTYALHLNSRQKTLTIEYSALDFKNPRNIQYAHMLEGLENDWLIERGQRTASYNNLEPGSYLFRLRSTNSDGVWVENERSLRVIVHPSFWQTVFARVLIVITILIIIAVTIYIIFTFYKLRHKVEVEQLITNLKLKFFTDISHELRTPLTLISSPVDNILRNNNLEPEVKEQLTLVQNNTERMLRLVNQILDFRKAQSRKMRLRIEEFALGSYISGICLNFRKIAEDKGIILTVEDLSAGETIWADKDKVEKIVYNLLSNALKFTPRNKQVTVSVTKKPDALELAVADQGTGLSREKMKNLFMRFSSDDGGEASLQPGTGIGLSLSRELADLHHAELSAESEEGKGAVFRVVFKLGFGHYENDTEFVISDNHTPLGGIDRVSEYAENEDGLSDTGEEQDKEPVLLFVEDNEELRSFLKIILADGFHVIEAGNGTEGLEIARSQLPDIIITDLMMPEKNGLELAREIKEDETTSHIPVVVLTARTDLDTQVDALKTGADDFITKPFSSTYLRAKIENILQQRKKLQEVFLASISDYENNMTRKTVEVNPSLPHVESFDDKLLKKLMTIMEENLDNSGLTVDELVSKLGIGRSVFFKKLKSLTGLAPVEFIREVRIKRAAQLIDTGQYTISQITYMVGCNDPRYFSRIFKQKYGLTPTEYREKHSKQKV